MSELRLRTVRCRTRGIPRSEVRDALDGMEFDLGYPPSLDPVHYASRITIPVLMINGRFDYLLGPESQERVFDLLPGGNKDRELIDSGHLMPRADLLRLILPWLDEQFGSVR